METSIDGKVVKPGQILTYQVKYTNTSKEKVEKIDITDVVPEHTKYVAGTAKSTVNGAAGPDGTEADGTITWTFTGDAETGIAAGTELVVTFNVEVLDDAGTVIENQAKVNDGKNTYDTNIVTNSKPHKDVFTEGKMDTSIDGKMVKPGQILTYQIKYTNTSKDKVAKIDITDKIPAHTKYVADTAKSKVDGKAGPDGTETGGTVTWTFTDDSETGFAQGTEFEVTFNVEVLDDSGALVKNTAQVQEGENTYDTNEVSNPTPFKLVIAKDLTDYVDNGEFVQATFAFEITGTYVDENGATQNYKNTIGMDFKKASDVHQTAIVTGIPSTIKDDLTVKEIYAGNYTPGEDTVKAELQKSGEYENMYLVEFTNTKDNHEYKGGVVNNYVKNENGEYKYKSPGTN